MVIALGLAAAAALVPAASASGADPIRFGAAVKPQGTESYQTAFARSEQRYGRLGVVRYFDGNGPDAWSSLEAKFSDRPAIVSFRISPSTVLSGSQDSALRSWFATAPTDRPTWFAYLHEPEDNIARGEFTAAQFRDAFAHVAAIADSVGNPQLHATLVLMCYTVNPTSGRNWRNYYADGAVDVIGWDCYNHKWRSNSYGTPENLMGRAVTTSETAGVPWGIAELGSVLANGDDGRGRAAWLTASARYIATEGGIFLSYFDTSGAKGTNYRLTDEPSRQAWYDVVSDQNPF
jgi:hypothetical protein